MVPEPPNVGSSFGFYRLEEVGEDRIGAAGKHKVLPDKNAEIVTGVVKDVLLVYPATPYAESIYVSL